MSDFLFDTNLDYQFKKEIIIVPLEYTKQSNC